MWEVIRDLVARGGSLLLTTQNLEESDLLADQIVVIDHGRAVAVGSADELKERVGGERLEVVVADGADLGRAAEVLRPVGVGEPTLDGERRSVLLPIGRRDALVEAVRRLDGAQVAVADAGVRRPTLDDALHALTGRTAQGDQPTDQPDDQPHDQPTDRRSSDSRGDGSDR